MADYASLIRPTCYDGLFWSCGSGWVGWDCGSGSGSAAGFSSSGGGGAGSGSALKLGSVLQRSRAEQELLDIGAAFGDALQSYALSLIHI